MINPLIFIIGPCCSLFNPNFLHWNEETVTATCLSPSFYVPNLSIKNGISFSIFVRNIKIHESFKNSFFLNKIILNIILGTKISFEVPIPNPIKFILNSIKYEIFEYIKYQKSIISLTRIYTILYTNILDDPITK